MATIKDHGVKIRVHMNRQGNLSISPATDNDNSFVRLNSNCDYVQATGIAWIQSNVKDWIDSTVPKRHRKDLYNGWTVTFFIYDEDFFGLFSIPF